MGTICFNTDKPAYDVLREEISRPIVDYTVSADCAVCAVLIDLDQVSDDEATMWRAMYDVKGTRLVIAAVIKHTGLRGIGRRSVSLKTMDETMGPNYYSSSLRTLQQLTEIRPTCADPRFALSHEWASNWRRKAIEAAYRAA